MYVPISFPGPLFEILKQKHDGGYFIYIRTFEMRKKAKASKQGIRYGGGSGGSQTWGFSGFCRGIEVVPSTMMVIMAQ